jgi:hypothetical protein
MSSCSNSECTCAEVIDSAERRQSLHDRRNLIEGIEDLLGPCAHGDVLRKIDPPNHAVRIYQKYGRPGNVRAFRSCAGMQHVVSANNFCLGIGKQRETVAEFLRLPPVDLRRIDADADYADPARIEIRKPVLKTPQLGVAERSPKAAIKISTTAFEPESKSARATGFPF